VGNLKLKKEFNKILIEAIFTKGLIEMHGLVISIIKRVENQSLENSNDWPLNT